MELHEGGVPSILIIPLTHCFVVVFLFIALLNGQRELTLLSLFVFGIVWGANLWSRKSLSGLVCHASLEKQRVFSGELVTINLHVENNKFLPVWLQMSISVDKSTFSPDRLVPQQSSLLWYQQAHFHWQFHAQHRGVYQLGPSDIRVGDPFGFFPRPRNIEERVQLLVYPHLVSLKPFSFPKRDFFGVPGAESPVQDPIYLLGTRDYQHWQPAKHIHWKASARHGRLQEKVFEPTAQEKVLLLVDVEQYSQDAAEEDFERTLDVVASLATRLDRNGCAVGVLTNGLIEGQRSPGLPATRNPQQLSAILELLARLRRDLREPLLETLRRHQILAGGLSCVHFSYQVHTTTRILGEYVAYRNIPIVFFVCQSDSNSGRDPIRRRVHSLDELYHKTTPPAMSL